VIAAGGPLQCAPPLATDNFVFHQTLVAFALPRPGYKKSISSRLDPTGSRRSSSKSRENQAF